jgi:hypothetical protein
MAGGEPCRVGARNGCLLGRCGGSSQRGLRRREFLSLGSGLILRGQGESRRLGPRVTDGIGEQTVVMGLLAKLFDSHGRGLPRSPWRAEARGHRGDAREAFTPLMRQHLALAALYREALRRLRETNDGQPPLPARTERPVTLDELRAEPPHAP